MGNSTISLQQVMDSIATIGDIQTVFDATAGWADEPAITIANDVMQELISIRFPWKWNRMKVPPFPLFPLQQDYASLSLKGVGWLENAVRIDVNNAMYPPPTWPIYAVRDIPMELQLGGHPYQVSWHFNRDLEQGVWPGPNKTYTWPIGVTYPPENFSTNINDVDGNILVLTKFGTTGNFPPVAPTWDDPSEPQPKDWPIGRVIEDGTCEWVVADPDAQGFRFRPVPPTGGNVWLVRIWAQRKAPRFLTLKQTIDPVPDDEEKWFRDGCIAYAHRYSSNAAVKSRFQSMKADWFGAMELATKKNDREDEEKGFFPDKSIMSPSYVTDPGPYPYRYGWR